ncbi:MAG: FtsX-like permease family protein [[Clostridium] leptum]
MVVKRSYSKMILREFRHSFSRFLAIFAIIALGVGFLAGLLATTPDMRYSMDQYYRQTNLMDLRIVSTMGLTKQDVEEIRSTEGVEDGMPSYTSDALVTLPSEDTAVARIHSLPACREAGEPLTSETSGYLNQLTLAEGRLPENPGECVIKPEHLSSENIPIGSTIKLSEENQNLEETFQTIEYIVVGYVYSSYYASIEKETSTVGNGTVGMVMFIPEQDFALDVYTDMFVTLSDAKALDSLSDPSAYDAAVDPLVSTLEDLGQQRAPLRDKEIREEAQEKIDDAQKEFEEQKADAQKQLDDARAELDNGWQELDSAKQELSDGKLALEEARRQLEEAPGQNSSGEAEIQSSEETLAQGQAEYDAGWQEYQSRKQEAEAAFAQQEQDLGQKEDEYNVNKAARTLKGKMDRRKQKLTPQSFTLSSCAARVDSAGPAAGGQLKPGRRLCRRFPAVSGGKAQLEYKLLLDQGRQTLEAAKQEAQQKFEETEGQLVGAKKELDDGWLQLDSAKAELAQAKLELENGRRELEENQKTLDDAQLQIDDSEKQLEEGEAEYLKSKTEADQKLSDAQKEIDDAQKELDQLEPSEWMVLGRDTNVGYVSFDSNAEKVEAIAKVFPIFFFLVAALVVLTTATRMVDEERTQIGVMKALGYGKGKIAAQYLIYVAVATITGSLFGLLVGFYVFPTVIWNAYTIMYDLPALVIQFNWKYALLSSGAAILTTLLTTFWACSVPKGSASRLILPKLRKRQDSAGEDNSPMVAFLYPQSHRPESVPVQKAVPDDGGRHRRLYRSAADRVWPPGFYFRYCQSPVWGSAAI